MADTLDLLTLAEAHAVINVPVIATTNDTELALIITAVSRRFDAICGPIVQRTYSNEIHNGAQQYGGSIGTPGYGRTSIRPKHTPVLSVVSLTEYSGVTPTVLTAETNTSQPASAYFLDTDGKHNVKIYRRSSGGDAYFASGRGNVLLTYLAGRATATSTVDAQFKEAAALTLQHIWNASSAVWTHTPNFGGATVDIGRAGEFSSIAPWEIPRAAKLIVADQLFPTFVG